HFVQGGSQTDRRERKSSTGQAARVVVHDGHVDVRDRAQYAYVLRAPVPVAHNRKPQDPTARSSTTCNLKPMLRAAAAGIAATEIRRAFRHARLDMSLMSPAVA